MASSFEATVEDEIATIKMGKPHLVLLGAGASRAAFPHGEASGRRLPVMADFATQVPGVAELLKKAGFSPDHNIETAYATIAAQSQLAGVRQELDRAIYDYFDHMALPHQPTLYDHLLLSLRSKDVVATFNWDPFLYQAARRNAKRNPTLAKRLPKIVFLHGNVLAGYCEKDNLHGYKGTVCSGCAKPFQAGPLLYPIAKKDYRSSPMISKSWDYVELVLEHCFMLTIFGYGAPHSDAAAMALFSKAWGGFEKRNMEQIEFINTQPEKQVLKSWGEFVHTHHYTYHTSFYESWIANHPRRTGEAYWHQFLDARFIDNNPLPAKADFGALDEWFGPLLEVEAKKDSAPHN